jgi:hypothetical protein
MQAQPRGVKRVSKDNEGAPKRMLYESQPQMRVYHAYIAGRLCSLTYEEYMHAGF